MADPVAGKRREGQTCTRSQGPFVLLLAEEGGAVVRVTAGQLEREALCFLSEGGLAERVFRLDRPCLNKNFVIVALRQTNSQSRNLALLSPINIR